MQLFLVVTAMLLCFRLGFFLICFKCLKPFLDDCEPQRLASEGRGTRQASYLNVTLGIATNKKFSTVDIRYKKIHVGEQIM